jgi:hypothetical protein
MTGVIILIFITLIPLLYFKPCKGRCKGKIGDFYSSLLGFFLFTGILVLYMESFLFSVINASGMIMYEYEAPENMFAFVFAIIFLCLFMGFCLLVTVHFILY